MNTTPDDRLLPHRLRQSSFRKYENTITKIVNTFPKVVVVPSGNLAAITIAARLRDAMLSLHTYGWPSSVNMAKFLDNYSDIKVSHRGASIVVGSREEIRRYDAVIPIELGSTAEELASLTDKIKKVDRHGFKFVCELVSDKTCGKVRVECNDADEPFTQSLEMLFDVRIDKQPDNSYIIS